MNISGSLSIKYNMIGGSGRGVSTIWMFRLSPEILAHVSLELP